MFSIGLQANLQLLPWSEILSLFYSTVKKPLLCSKRVIIVSKAAEKRDHNKTVSVSTYSTHWHVDPSGELSPSRKSKYT